ncbi:MFS transporter [Micromonospora sp. WMMD1155]|uniref:MFS transporter n=1 Tax=Micromonospora sp. WMMD1155 TaxID=3016094 RepID=UPI00249BD537|nr:MFS transporter [Micromonospora sp. WMMD1155]WFE53148.1 MFS transporter [Micromonospora sp. WMMD1155]
MAAERWWAPTGVATAAMATSMTALYATSALAPFLVADLGLSRTAVGALVTVSFAVAAGVSLIAGHLIDLGGARRGLLALCVAVLVALLGASVAPGYGWLLVAVAVAGLGQALANPATNVLVAGAVPPQRRGSAIGVKQAGVQLAAFACGLVLPAVATLADWRVALRVSALVPLATVIAVWWWVPAAARRATAGSWWRLSAPTGWLTWLVAFSLLLGTGLAAVNTYLPLYATQRLGLGTGVGGALLAAFGVTGLLARVWWGRWADRSAEVAVALVWLAAAAVVGVLLVLSADHLWAGLVWVGAVVVGGSATAANALSMLMVLRHGKALGQASGLVSVGFFGGFVVGPTTVGWCADAGGWGAAWLVVAAVFVGTAMLAMRVRSASAQPKVAA